MLHPVRILTVLLFACAALAAGLGEARAERRVALVMGNAAYKNPELVLPNARNDAEDVAAALKKLGFEVLLETDVDLAAAGKAIQQFARLAADADASLFFYAGHAVQHQGHNYLLPVDAEINDEISLAFGAVGVDNVRGVLDRAKGVKIMALDACRDNPVAGRLARADNGVSAAPEREARSRGLRRGDRPDEILIAFAAAPGSVAYDGDGRNSPFTKAFLKRLAEPGLEVETLFRRVAGDVIAATDGRQRPETYAALAGDYYLNEADRLAWEKVKDSDDPAVLRDFMERFPSSFHAIEARYRVVALERALAAQKERALREAEAARREKEAAERAAAERLRQETERQRQEAERRRLEQEAAVLRQKQEAACGGERAALAAAPARDPEALRRLLGGACPEAVAAARQRLAELERVLAAEAEACRKEDGALAALGPRDLDGLRAASASTCPAVAAAAAGRLKSAEAEIAHEAEICRREDADVRRLAARADAPALDALRARAQCPATAAAVASALGDVAAGVERARLAACDRDGARLAAIPEGDVEALKAFLGRTPCAAATQTAQARLAAAETAQAEEAALCRAEDQALAPLVAKGDPDGLGKLRATARCPATLAAIDRSLQEIAAARRRVAQEAEALCARESAALEALGPADAKGLAAFEQGAACPAAKAQAGRRLADARREETRLAELCRRDAARLGALGDADDAALEAFGKSVECPAVAVSAASRIAALKARCAEAEAALAALRGDDADGLRGFSESGACASVRAQAGAKLAALEAEAARAEEICRREDVELDALRAEGPAAREKLLAMKRGLACARLAPEAAAALEALPVVNDKAQISAAQGELRRVGCLSTPATGALDRRTKEAFARYFAARGGEPSGALTVDDALVGRLREEGGGVCGAPAVVEKKKPASKKDLGRLPAEEEPRARPEPRTQPKPARERAARPAPEKPARVARPERAAPPAQPQAQSTARRPGSTSPIGVGF